jgi:uncharacterized protein involved in exopolysaccharide biosynthesis
VSVDKLQEQQAERLDAYEIFALLCRRRAIVLWCTLVSTALLTLVAFIATPIYRGTVVVLPANLENGDLASSMGSLSGLSSLVGINLSGNDSDLDEALAILQSERFTDAFITGKNLMPVLFERKWDRAAGKWKPSLFKHPTISKGFHKFDDDVRKVTTSTKSELISISVDWKDREKAAEWANELVAMLNAEMRARAVAKADASLTYLQSELLRTTDVSTRDAISHLIEQQVKQRMLANVTVEYALRVVDRALVPDEDDPVKPWKTLLIVAGTLFGFVVGLLTATLRESRWWQRRFPVRAAQ